jgi:streptogramin lyase
LLLRSRRACAIILAGWRLPPVPLAVFSAFLVEPLPDSTGCDGTPMRILIIFIASLSLASADDKAHKSVVPKAGIKTPGIQIPFANLKAEAEFEARATPDWIYFFNLAFAPGKDAIEKIDPKTNNKSEPISGLTKPCGGMTAAFGSLWAPVCGTSSLARIDAKTYKVTNTVPTGVGSVRGVIAATTDGIWLLTDEKTTLSRIDPDQNLVVGELRVPAGCRSLTFGETALWLACPAGNKVLRINPATNLVEKSIEVSSQPEALAVAEGSIWALCRKDGKIDRIDPKTNKVSKTIELGVPNADGGIAFGDGFLWVTQTGFPLARIDVVSETVMQQFAGVGGGALAVSPGAIWLSNVKARTIWRIDPKRVIATLPD